MKKLLTFIALATFLSACAGTSSSGNTQMYGQIGTGVETTFK